MTEKENTCIGPLSIGQEVTNFSVRDSSNETLIKTTNEQKIEINLDNIFKLMKDATPITEIDVILSPELYKKIKLNFPKLITETEG
jgi:hypothetical protein